MTVYITAIAPSSATAHEHIGRIRWLSSHDSTSKSMSISDAVAWVREGNKFVVASDTGPVEVQVVDTATPHLRTVANAKWSDNLLALPKF